MTYETAIELVRWAARIRRRATNIQWTPPEDRPNWYGSLNVAKYEMENLADELEQAALQGMK